MQTEENNKIKSVISKAVKLGWVQRGPDGELYMNVADVEKTIYALLDEFEMKRLDNWVVTVVATKTACKSIPDMKIRELERLRKIVDAQGKFYGDIIHGKKCIMKICPFFEKEVPEKK